MTIQKATLTSGLVLSADVGALNALAYACGTDAVIAARRVVRPETRGGSETSERDANALRCWRKMRLALGFAVSCPSRGKSA